MTAGAPLLEHGRHHMDLSARQNLAQMLPIQPRPSSPFGGAMAQQLVKIRTLAGGQILSVLEQGPAQSPQGRISFLFGPSHLVYGCRRMRDDVKRIERDASMRQVFVDSLDEGRRHVNAGRGNLVSLPSMSCHMLGQRLESRCIPTFRHKEHLALVGIGDQGQIGMATLTGSFVNGDGAHVGQVGNLDGQVNIQDLLGGIKIHVLNELRSLKAQRRSKDVVWHHVPPYTMKGQHARAARRK